MFTSVNVFFFKSVLDENTDKTELPVSTGCNLRDRGNFCKVTSTIFSTCEIFSLVFGYVVVGLSPHVVVRQHQITWFWVRSHFLTLVEFFFTFACLVSLLFSFSNRCTVYNVSIVNNNNNNNNNNIIIIIIIIIINVFSAINCCLHSPRTGAIPWS